jgi:arylsulfatase A-like enzyme
MAHRRDLLKALSAGAMNAVIPNLRPGATPGAALTASPATPRSDQPNIIFIFSDQHRARMTKLSGYPLDTSPTLDSLAENGVNLDMVEFMRQQKLLEKTIIVYMADHGDYLMDYGLGRKGAGLLDCLTRVPMVWSGPGITKGQLHHPACVSNADIFPTLCEAIGVDIPHGVQGRSLWPLLQGKDYPEEEFRSICSGVGFGGLYYDESYAMPYRLAESPPKGDSGQGPPTPLWNIDELNPVTQSGTMKMVRMGDWKLIYDMMGYGQLYNLASDPCELNNLFGKPFVADEQLRLAEELLMWTIRNQDTLPVDEPKEDWQSTRWSKQHNWYAPYRHGKPGEPFIP